MMNTAKLHPKMPWTTAAPLAKLASLPERNEHLDELKAYLGAMPRNRASAKVLIRCADRHDHPMLYETLLTNYSDHLNTVEYESVVDRARILFDEDWVRDKVKHSDSEDCDKGKKASFSKQVLRCFRDMQQEYRWMFCWDRVFENDQKSEESAKVHITQQYLRKGSIGNRVLYHYEALRNRLVSCNRKFGKKLYRKIISLGAFLRIPNAQARYGELINDKRAYELYWNAALHKSTRGLFDLGISRNSGFCCERDGGEAYDMVKESACKGYPKAQFVLGHSLMDSDSEFNREEGLRWITSAANRGYADARFYLANHYTQEDTARNCKLVRKWLKRAVCSGHVEAMFMLGKQEIAARHDWRGQKLLLRAARKGYAEAQLEYGRNECKFMGPYFSMRCRGYFWIEQAAKNGYIDAQCYMGDLFSWRFWEISKHEETALCWYLKAAEQGDEDAQCKVARWYLRGIGTDKNEVLAFKWFTHAKDKGSFRARNELARMKAQGIDEDDLPHRPSKDEFYELYWDFDHDMFMRRALKQLSLYPFVSILTTALVFLFAVVVSILNSLRLGIIPELTNANQVINEPPPGSLWWYLLLMLLVYVAGKAVEALHLRCKYSDEELSKTFLRSQAKIITIRCTVQAFLLTILTYAVSKSGESIYNIAALFTTLMLSDGFWEWITLLRAKRRYNRKKKAVSDE